jgi:CheY-like chemotaxis protein
MEREHVEQSLRGVYVLVVDSDSRHREIVRDILRYCGAWVRDVDSTEDALAVLRETTPSALVVTMRESGEPSWALLRAVRAMRPEHGGKVPAVGIGPRALGHQALAHGFDVYLPEPIETWSLCRAVAELTE